MADKVKMKLSDLKKKWKGAVENKEEFGVFIPEEGTYNLVLTSASVGESKSSGRLQVTWEVTFLDGDYKEKSKRFYDGLDREESLPFVIRRIESLGVEAPEEFDELEEMLKKLTKKHPKFKGQITNKNDFSNLKILKLLSAEELEGSAEEPEEVEETPVATDKTVSKEESEPEASLEVGMEVKVEGEKSTGKILEINEEEKEATVKINGKKRIVELSELSPVKEEVAEDEGDTLEIEVGKVVKALDEDDDEIGEGKIMSIDKKKEECVVKIAGTKHVVSFEKLRKA